MVSEFHGRVSGWDCGFLFFFGGGGGWKKKAKVESVQSGGETARWAVGEFFGKLWHSGPNKEKGEKKNQKGQPFPPQPGGFCTITKKKKTAAGPQTKKLEPGANLLRKKKRGGGPYGGGENNPCPGGGPPI